MLDNKSNVIGFRLNFKKTNYTVNDIKIIENILINDKIIISIDGPKGSGKSTLAKSLKSFANGKDFYFGPTKAYGHQYTQELLRNFIMANQSAILERGPLSDLAYLLTRGADFAGVVNSIDVESEKPKVNAIPTWQLITYQNLIDYYTLPNSLHIILYASNPDKLIENLNKRNQRCGKYANEEEFNNLCYENLIYKSTIKNLLIANPSLYPNVKLYDISTMSYEDLYQKIYEDVDELRNRILQSDLATELENELENELEDDLER